MLEIEVANDWLDYAQAFGGIGALVLAIAGVDPGDQEREHSSRSVDAAGRTAKTAADQIGRSRQVAGEEELAVDPEDRGVWSRERTRQPRVAMPALAIAPRLPSERPPINDPVGVTAIAFWPVVVGATFENIGDRAAEQALVRFLVPETVGLVRSGPAREDRTR